MKPQQKPGCSFLSAFMTTANLIFDSSARPITSVNNYPFCFTKTIYRIFSFQKNTTTVRQGFIGSRGITLTDSISTSISRMMVLTFSAEKRRRMRTGNVWREWLEKVCGHHGFIHRDSSLRDWRLPTRSMGLVPLEQQTRKAWVGCLEEIFLNPCGLSIADNPPPPSPLLAGFCSVADWLGSRSDEHHFFFKKELVSPSRYFLDKAGDAGSVLKLSGIISESKPYAGVSKLLPEGANPRGVQEVVDRLPMESGLTVVEAPTGSGKTEMALAYAWRLLEEGLAESIIFALPTQATTNKMYDRLTPLAVRLFKDHPNLLLAHGNARFNEKFIAIKNAAQAVQNEGEAWAQCCQWLSQSRKRVFLGQIGVCTVDQVLIAVLPVRHRFVRGFGLGRSVLIIDEVHAYDAYMYGLMQQVLKDQQSRGRQRNFAFGNATCPSTPEAVERLGDRRRTWGRVERISHDHLERFCKDP